jgi:hypothetical protein
MGADQKKTAKAQAKLPKYLVTGAGIHQCNRGWNALYLLVLGGDF